MLRLSLRSRAHRARRLGRRGWARKVAQVARFIHLGRREMRGRRRRWLRGVNGPRRTAHLVLSIILCLVMLRGHYHCISVQPPAPCPVADSECATDLMQWIARLSEGRQGCAVRGDGPARFGRLARRLGAAGTSRGTQAYRGDAAKVALPCSSPPSSPRLPLETAPSSIEDGASVS